MKLYDKNKNNWENHKIGVMQLDYKYKEMENKIIEKNRQKEELIPILDEKKTYETELENYEKILADKKEKKNSILSELEHKKSSVEFNKNQLENMLKDVLKRKVTIKI